MSRLNAWRLSALLAFAILEFSSGFSIPRPDIAFGRTSRAFPAVSGIHATKSASVPEYSVGEEDDNEIVEIVKEDAPVQATVSEPVADPTKKSAPTTPKQQYAAMEPGTVVHIQVGDVSLARKAWKKRRRSGSPLLVPCSVLTVNRQSTVRWNLIYLLEKFGASHEGGIRMSLADLTRRHRKHLQSSLTQQATAMGYETAKDLVVGLFNKQVQETYGVKLVLGDEQGDDSSDTLWLQAPISRFRAQKRAGKAAVMQLSDEADDDALKHTGVVRNRRKEGDEGSNLYSLRPLSAALRVSQEDVDSGTIQNGSMHAAVVFDYDPYGDGGFPLITLSLDPARGQVRDRLKIVDQREIISKPKYLLHELGAGQGPIKGKVARLIKGGALVDCDVGRRKSNSRDAIKVYGMLRFNDAIQIRSKSSPQNFQFVDDEIPYEEEEEDDDDEDWEDIMSSVNEDIDEDENEAASAHLKAVMEELDNDEEFAESEDITHMFETNEDGSLLYTDPESGESQVVDMEDEEEDQPLQRDPASTVRSSTPSNVELISSSRPLFMYVGDELDVYVKSVSKQSGQVLLTLDSTVQGRKAKDIKKEGELSKKLSRLSKQLGGLHRIDQLRGQHYDGVVKATSNAGDWFYVQPTTGELEEPLPVGIATAEGDNGADLKQGDAVRIEIEGVDEDRGQLSLKVLHKL